VTPEKKRQKNTNGALKTTAESLVRVLLYTIANFLFAPLQIHVPLVLAKSAHFCHFSISSFIFGVMISPNVFMIFKIRKKARVVVKIPKILAARPLKYATLPKLREESGERHFCYRCPASALHYSRAFPRTGHTADHSRHADIPLFPSDAFATSLFRDSPKISSRPQS
jgi:hypothetical protein